MKINVAGRIRIIVFGGTTEGREAVLALLKEGYETALSVATRTGLEALQATPLQLSEERTAKIIVGRKDEKELISLITEYDICIDATHPYAREITQNLKHACEVTKTPYYRLLREKSDSDKVRPSIPGFETRYVRDTREAAELLKKSSDTGNILLTTGSKELSAFEGIDRERLYARVLPTKESIEACEKNGIPRTNILALWGPFSKALNLALLLQYKIRFLVTKESGKEGGFTEKYQAAEEAGCSLIIIERPEENGMTLEEILRELERNAFIVNE